MGYHWRLKVNRCGVDYGSNKSTFQGHISFYFDEDSATSFTVGSSKKSDIHVGGISPNHLTLQLGKDKLLIHTEEKIEVETKEKKVRLAKGETLELDLNPYNFVQKIIFANGASIQGRFGQESEKLPPKYHSYLTAKHGTLSKIQEGSSSLIFRTADNQVLKVLRPSYATNVDLVQRFLRAAEKFQQINSPFFGNVKEILRDDDHLLYYVVMDYFPSETLENYLSKRGTIDKAQSKAIVTNISKALLVLEEQNYSCRNLSPSNILIGHDNEIKISGFFLIKSMDVSVTAPGAQIIIPGYTSPEQIKDPTNVDVMADVFSLGTIYYRMFVGEPPITANNTHEYAFKLQNSDGFSRRDIEEASTNIPLETVDLIAKLLYFRKEDRPNPQEIQKLLLPKKKPRAVHIDQDVEAPSQSKNARPMESMLLRTYFAIFCIVAICFTFIPTASEKKAAISSNETSAYLTLNAFSTSQAQFQSAAVVDQDQDGIGEHGTLNELAGSITPRGANSPVKPGFLSAKYAASRTLSDGFGVAVRNGYMFRVYLPGGVSDQGRAKSVSPLSSSRQSEAIDQQEKGYLVYAWPEEFGRTGRRVFIKKGLGAKSYKNEDGRFSGDNAPPYDAALTKESNKVDWKIAANKKESRYGIVFSHYSIFQRMMERKQKKSSNFIDQLHSSFREIYQFGYLGFLIVTGSSKAFGSFLVLFVIYTLFFTAAIYSATLYSLFGRSPIYAIVPVLNMQVLAKETNNPYPWLTAIVLYFPVFLAGVPFVFNIIFGVVGLLFWIRLNYFLAKYFKRDFVWIVLLCLFPLLAQASLYLRIAKEQKRTVERKNRRSERREQKSSEAPQEATRSPRARRTQKRKPK